VVGMPEWRPEHLPYVNSDEPVIVVYNPANKLLRIGMMNYPFEENFALALRVIEEDIGKVEMIKEGRFYKVCENDTILALLSLYEKAAVKRAWNKLQQEDPVWWENLNTRTKILHLLETEITVRKRVAGRFELFWLTIPSILSQYGDEEYLLTFVDENEYLVKRILKEQPSSAESYSSEEDEVSRLPTSATLPARVYRIIPSFQAIPAGFRVVHISEE